MRGMINAQNTIIADLVNDWLRREDDQHQALEMLKENWLAKVDQPTSALLSVEPVQGDLIAQETREAINLLAKAIGARLRPLRPG
jgi:hypothetical protein